MRKKVAWEEVKYLNTARLNFVKLYKKRRTKISDLAEFFGVTKVNVWYYLNGSRRLTIYRMKQICDYYKISLNFLVSSEVIVTAKDLIKYIKKKKPINKMLSTQMINILDEVYLILKNKNTIKKNKKELE